MIKKLLSIFRRKITQIPPVDSEIGISNFPDPVPRYKDGEIIIAFISGNRTSVSNVSHRFYIQICVQMKKDTPSFMVDEKFCVRKEYVEYIIFNEYDDG